MSSFSWEIWIEMATGAVKPSQQDSQLNIENLVHSFYQAFSIEPDEELLCFLVSFSIFLKNTSDENFTIICDEVAKSMYNFKTKNENESFGVILSPEVYFREIQRKMTFKEQPICNFQVMNLLITNLLHNTGLTVDYVDSLAKRVINVLINPFGPIFVSEASQSVVDFIQLNKPGTQNLDPFYYMDTFNMFTVIIAALIFLALLKKKVESESALKLDGENQNIIAQSATNNNISVNNTNINPNTKCTVMGLNELCQQFVGIILPIY